LSVDHGHEGQIGHGPSIAALDRELELQRLVIGRRFGLRGRLRARPTKRHQRDGASVQRQHLRGLLALDERMHRRHDIAEQLELAHLPVAVLVGPAFDRPGEGPAQSATLLALDRHLRHELVGRHSGNEGDVLEVVLGDLGNFGRR
jgi:glycerol-3-phosphate O-acyltransferase